MSTKLNIDYPSANVQLEMHKTPEALKSAAPLPVPCAAISAGQQRKDAMVAPRRDMPNCSPIADMA
eukprot:2769344-Pleurochrysis_carterae.AAC.2